MTYGELLSRAGRLGRSLRKKGVERGAIVGLLLEKSPETLVGMLGTLWAGAAFLPLHPELPPERLAFMAADAGLRWVVSREQYRSRLDGAVTFIDVDDGADEAPLTGEDVPVEVGAEDLAYVIYTSGSTGRPKGVLVPHRGLVSLLDAQIAAFGMGLMSRSLLYLSTSFDASISDIGTALLAGATLFIDEEMRRSPAGLLEVLRARRITHLDLPPALLRVLDPAQVPESLETLIIGGEASPPEVVRRWAARLRVVNVYGPTEATICTSLCACNPVTWTRPLLGAPIPGMSMHVLDHEQRPVSAETPGELYLTGAGLALGYLDRPALNAEKFVTLRGERCYRTGDRVVRHADGEIEFLGRVDRQVKLRGLLIEPEEMEAQLLRHPDVMEAAVLLRDLGRERQGLVAFLVARDPAQPPSAGLLGAHLSRALPPWMLPQRCVVLARMPVTPSGKVDMQKLASWPLHDTAEAMGAPPRNPREVRLLALFRQVLGRDDLGVTDDFFAMGGDSLSVLEVVAAAEAAGLPLSPTLLMSRPTIASLVDDDRWCQEKDEGGCSAATLRADVAALLGAGWHNPDPSAAAPHAPRTGPPKEILLTGATGFLGARLLHELLLRTGARIHCLVRARDPAEARSRLFPALSAMAPSDAARIIPIPGDLAQPRLGLDAATWTHLFRSIDTVYHCAARVNLLQPYQALRPDNVLGTREVLRLLREGPPKRLHYASTLSVLVATDRNTGTLSEDDDLAATQVIHGGYAQSKWAAECLLRAGDAPGPISIYRLGLITGDTTAFAAPPADLLSLFLSGIASLGCVPKDALAGLAVDITPVDFAAAALCHLSLESGPGTFHIANPHSLPAEALVAALRRAGRPIARVSEEQFLARLGGLLKEGGRAEEAAACLALCRRLSAQDFGRLRTLDLFQATGARFAMERTLAGLAGSGLSCPPPDAALLDAYVRHLLAAARPKEVS